MPRLLIPTAQFFKEIQAALIEKRPFVVYRKPMERMLNGFFPGDRKLRYVTDHTESGFVFAPFDAAKRAVFFDAALSRAYTCESPLGDFSGTVEEVEAKSLGAEGQRTRHLGLVDAAIDFIQTGKARKVVVSRMEKITTGQIGPEEIFRRLLQRNPSAFVYLWHQSEVGLWTGASPETLLQMRGDRFQTMALAGTQKYKGNLEVAWGDKEAEEQQMVTDHIVSELYGIELIRKGPYTLRAGGLLHLCTEISGRLAKGQGLGDLIGRLHPTAAVCGLPRNRAMEFLRDKEGYEREFYTGFLGEMNLVGESPARRGEQGKCSSSLYVNLRCMRLESPETGTAIIFAGGGITASSDPEKEWEETMAKAQVMKSIFKG